MRFFLRLLLLVLPLTVAAEDSAKNSPKNADDPRFVHVDKVIQGAIDSHAIPGAVVLVGHKGEVVYRKAYGKRSIEPTIEEMTTDTIFDAASLTKVMATTPSLMKLYQEG